MPIELWAGELEVTYSCSLAAAKQGVCYAGIALQPSYGEMADRLQQTGSLL
jgi:hypothetical protein